MLSIEQTRQFEAKGYLHLPGLVDRAKAAGMEDFVWSRLHALHGIERDDPAT